MAGAASARANGACAQRHLRRPPKQAAECSRIHWRTPWVVGSRTCTGLARNRTPSKFFFADP
eukprot:15239170-Heterocapsa_arctica.AAC.1